jgi:hypothetical protein
MVDLVKLPSRLTLPSGAVIRIRLRDPDASAPIARSRDAPLFEEVRVALATDAGALALRDFHVVRAILARSGVIEEEEIEVSCRNCGATIRLRPCAKLEIGPWVDAEAKDEELDVTLPFGEPIDVPPIELPGGDKVRSVTFEDRTVDEARALFVAAAKKPFDVTPQVVRAMGIVALGDQREAETIAEALADCDDDAYFAVCEAFLASHYVSRLGCAVFCDECGARNDVDAPYEREVTAGARAGTSTSTSRGALPNFEAFADRARAIARPLMRKGPTRDVELVIEGGTPEVDDGGEPLLGSYVPPHAGDASGIPTRAPVVTVYYRTFKAMWDEDGPYDWEAELTETIEHELEHHVYFLRGDDPMDDEERAVIDDEAVRIVGRRESSRRAIEGFGASWRDFLARTWPLWVLAALALAFTLATQGD